MPDEDGTIANTRQLFFKTLRKYNYDKRSDELKFEKWNLVVNISALRCGEQVLLGDPRKLFRQAHDLLSTTILFNEPGSQLQDIGPGPIGGMCEGLPASENDIQYVCSVKLKLMGGRPLYQNFEKPGNPRMAGIPAFDARGNCYGHWRFEKMPVTVTGRNCLLGKVLQGRPNGTGLRLR